MKKCDKSQRFTLVPRQPPEDLNPVRSLWPFHQCGLDIVRPLPIAPRQKRFLILATDYFTKWIEAKPLSKIGEQEVKSFIWKNIVCRFGIPRILVSDNGTQFIRKRVSEFCKELCIERSFSTPRYPQGNGQAEISNRTILNGIKKRLEAAKVIG